MSITSTFISTKQVSALSLYHLLEPEVLANPYPLYQRLRSEDPVHWDPYLHSWVITRYSDAVRVFQQFSAARMPTPEQLVALGLEAFTPIAQVMVRQMLFLDPPAHTHIRTLAAQAFTPHRVKLLATRIREVTCHLLEAVHEQGKMDVIADLAYPLPAIITSELLGTPSSDWKQLTIWSSDFAQLLGNFQHSPDHTAQILHSLEEMISYFRAILHEQKQHPHEGLITTLMTAEIDGVHLSDEDIIANTIVTMVGGLETTTNLIGNGLLSLLRHPYELAKLQATPSLILSTVEELLRYESPSQHTARLAPENIEIGGKYIRKRQAVIVVMGAANRDPERFADPDRLDICRADNRHVAFAWGNHFCFGAPLARLEGQIVFETLLQMLPELHLATETVTWRENLGLRGLTALPVTF